MKKTIITYIFLFAAACSPCRTHAPDVKGCPAYSYGYRGERCYIPQDLVEKMQATGQKHLIVAEGNQCQVQVFINQQIDGDIEKTFGKY